METKVCSKCNIEKNVCEFYCHKQKKDKLTPSCKDCVKKNTKKYRENNPSKVKENKKKEYRKNIDRYKKYNEKYRQLNREYMIQYLKNYFFENKEKIRRENKKRYEQKKEIILDKQKLYSESNKEKRNLYLKEYYEKNKEKIKENRRQYFKQRRKDDILFNLKNILSHRLRIFLKTKNIKKNNNTREMIGCNPESLKEHLEKQFVSGMTWENRGEWHIDHIIPLSSAKNEEELYRLCHYTNLQPLWAQDNIKKGNKIVGPINIKNDD